MSITDKIEQQWLSYVGETGRMPKYLFLGFIDMTDLDKKLGMVTFRYKEMDVVGVERERHVSVGDKYAEV
jgi:hypothetical protein